MSVHGLHVGVHRFISKLVFNNNFLFNTLHLITQCACVYVKKKKNLLYLIHLNEFVKKFQKMTCISFNLTKLLHTLICIYVQYMQSKYKAIFILLFSCLMLARSCILSLLLYQHTVIQGRQRASGIAFINSICNTQYGHDSYIPCSVSNWVRMAPGNT